MKSALFISFLLFLTAFCKLPAQAPAFRLEEVKLPVSSPVATVDCLFEDSRGFLWIGAYTGLYRYNGYELLHFRHDPNNPYSIGDNKIKRMVELPDGRCWIGTQVGMNFFDPFSRHFTAWTDTARHGIGKVEINDLLLAPDKRTLWAAAADGLYRLDANRERFVKIFPAPGNPSVFVSAIQPAPNGIYFAQPGRLWYLPDGADASQPAPLPLRADTIINLYTSPDGALWTGATNGLFRIDPATRQATEISALRGARVSTITPWRDGRWLVSTGKGQYLLHTGTSRVEGPLWVQLDGKNQQIKNTRLSFTTSNGITWFCSNTRKIYKADAQKERFRHAPLDLMEPLKHPSAFCELFEYEPGRLLLPRTEGACLFDIRTGKIAPFPYAPPYNRQGWNKGVTSFLPEGDSLLWIGTDGGLFLLDKSRGRFVALERDFKDLEQLRNISIRKIHRDRKGRLWLASWQNGVYKIDFPNRTFRHYNYSAAHQAAYQHGSRTILEARNGDLWFGTRGGLLKYLENRDSFLVYRNIPNDPTSMSENTAFCLYEDATGNIWSGSYGGGLNYLDVSTGKFKHYTTDDGLLNNNVFSLLPDHNGKLWILTFNGITLFDPARMTFRTFTHDQGLLNTAFDAFFYGKSRYSNALFFGGAQGIDYFDPHSVSVLRPPPTVRFSTFRLFNEPVPVSGSRPEQDGFVLPQDPGFIRQITLRYDQNVIGFDFAALEYSAPQTVQYAYQLAGFDTAWQYVRDKRSVTFTNLNPGDYTLRVKSSNNDGVWEAAAPNVTALEITITPPWWRTWLFRISVVLALAALILALYNYRIRQIREREALKSALNQRIAQVKMEALRAQMNPHFVFNCLSSLKLFVEKNETEKASDHISKFATLLRRVLDDARTDTETIPLERELDTLRRYVELEMIRFKDKFEFRMDVDPNADLQNTEVPPLILQPYVENAILHGLQHKTEGKGLLLVRVGQDDGYLSIIVEDNGVGRAAARAIKARNAGMPTSHGLNVTAERLDYFSQKYDIRTAVETTDLSDPSDAAAGTRVTLTFQIN